MAELNPANEVITIDAIRECVLDAIQPCIAAEERHKKAIIILTREVQALRKELAEWKNQAGDNFTNIPIASNAASKKTFKKAKNIPIDPIVVRVEPNVPFQLHKSIPNQPFTTHWEFLDFEAKLREDDIFFQQLETEFHLCLINNPRKFVKNCWRQILQDEAAEHFSWRGTEEKKSVRGLMTSTAIRNVYNSKKVGSEADYVAATKSFFQFAKNRQKQRNDYRAQKASSAISCKAEED